MTESSGSDQLANAQDPKGLSTELKPLSADEIRESRESARAIAAQEDHREKRRGRFSRAREKRLVKQERKARRRSARAAAESEMAAQFEREDDTLQ